MEVHHHGHAAHGKKNWRSYLWEFLMLFLAVFCGFLAEYQLEHKIEKDRGRQYLRSFYEDLITDSAHFNSLIQHFEDKMAVFQTMSPCYDSLMSDHPPENCFSRITGQTLVFLNMIYTDRTIAQLKNAGGLRLLKKEDADSILLYDNRLRVYKEDEMTGFQKVQNDLRELFSQLRDYATWKDTAQSPRITAVYGPKKDLLNTYFNELTIYFNFARARLNALLNIKKRNAGLIGYFKNKYHWE